VLKLDEVRLAEKIIETELEKLPKNGDVYEKHIYLDDQKVLIVGYKKEESYCEEDPQEECGITFYWYWELRDSENWDLIEENTEKDFNFCVDSEKNAWSDENTFDEIGDVSGNTICTWSDQDRIEDIAEDIAEEVMLWLKR
jgi:hypothetical protein